MLVFIDFQDGDLSLSYKEDDCDSRLISSQSYADVGGVWVKQQLPFLIHLEKQIAVLNEKHLLISLGDLHVFFIVSDELACFEICVVAEILA
jgi:hypothetical protein